MSTLMPTEPLSSGVHLDLTRSDPNQPISLEVRTDDEGAQIFVIDGAFQLAARGVGQLEAQLKPGIYSIKVQVGSEAREEHIVLRPGDGPVTKKIEPLQFTSPVPLLNTTKTHEYHQAAVWDEVNKQHVIAGAGSAIYVFVRDWRPDEYKRSGNLHPARGLTLRQPNGDEIVSFEERSARDTGEPDPWAACNVVVNPGLYILRLTLTSGDHLEQTIVASPNWQTQIFLLQRAYGPTTQDRQAEEDRQADLLDASMLLARFPGTGRPSERDLRMVELARLGLAEGRRVLSSEIRQILEGKFENPLLGIYGGHLLLLEKEPDLQFLETIVHNLRNILGAHPDVEALALALEGDNSSYIFEMPPMLRRSWWNVISASVKKPEIVPAGSLAARATNLFSGSELWHQWLIASGQSASAGTEDASTSKREKVSTASEEIVRSQMASFLASTASQAGEMPSSPSRAVELPSASALETHEEAAAGEDVPVLDDEKYAELVETLGLPRSAIEEIAKELRDSS